LVTVNGGIGSIMPHVQSALIEVRRVRGKGRGVFARVSIAKGTVIERVPVIVVPMGEIVTERRQSVVMDHAFEWDRKSIAIALGYGCLYNHSYEPNAEVYVSGLTQEFVALRRIRPGEEITFNYNGSSRSRAPVDFPVV